MNITKEVEDVVRDIDKFLSCESHITRNERAAIMYGVLMNLGNSLNRLERKLEVTNEITD